MRKLDDIALFVNAHYDLEVTRIGKLTEKVYKIETPQKEFLLKFAKGDDEFLTKQMYAHKEMPDTVLPIYETNTGDRVAYESEYFAYLTDYVRQSPMPLEARVRDYSKLLRTLHETTKITVDKNEDEISWMYTDDYEELEENFTMLENMVTQVEMKLSRSPFEWQLLMTFPLIYGMYRRSDEMMQKFYKLLSRKKRIPISMIHGDVNVSNVLPTTNKTHIINFESSSFDIPTKDLIKFLNFYHQSSGTTNMIAEYLRSQKNQLIVYHFFMKSLCFDFKTFASQLTGNSLIDLSMFNERLAPAIIAMNIFEEMYTPKKPDVQEETKES